jgi:hypothetical protein
MDLRPNLLCSLASLFFLALPLTAHAQGDPNRGAMLYVSYQCTSCHNHPIPPDRAMEIGSTAQGLLNSILFRSNGLMSSFYGSTLAQNPTDLADLAAYIALTAEPPPTPPDLNQHGLTGSWYEPATSGQGIEVEIFSDPSSGSGSTFVSWFTFDTSIGGADHQRWYTAQGPVTTGQPYASLTIYQNTDGNFNAPPATTATPVGTATLSFSTCTSGQLLYSFTDGTSRAGNIALTRLIDNVTCSTSTPYPTNADFALSGNWYAGPATGGQGLTVEVNPITPYLFVAWYTYEPMGAAAGASGQRWYTAQAPAFTAGMRSIPVTIYETTGGTFDTPIPPPGPATVPVGSGTLAFQSCTAATLNYTFTGGTSSGLSGTIALSRVGPVPPGCAS